MPDLAFAGILTEKLSGAIASLVAFTALFGGAAHYGSILSGGGKDKTE